MTIQALMPVRHWTAARKAEVVWALARRLITPAQACAAHGLSAEELEAWTLRHSRFGRDGLKMTRVQQLRAQRAEPCRFSSTGAASSPA